MHYYQKGNGITQNISNAESFFRTEEKYVEKYTPEEVKEYLLGVVSGRMYPTGIEHGQMYVSYEKLKELVKAGYNIVKVLNVDTLSANKIHIEYQICEKEDKYNKEFRRRN